MSGASTAETLVVALGNPLLGDDAVGWRVVDAVRRVVAGGGGPDGDEGAGDDGPDGTDGAGHAPRRRPVAFEWLQAGGLALMERLVGERRAILVDAVVTGADPPGTIRRVGADALPAREASHLDSAHDVTFAAALELGRRLGASLPEEVTIVTIEAAAVGEFGAPMTPAVAAAVPAAAALVLGLLEG